jgi:hypothetical protein
LILAVIIMVASYYLGGGIFNLLFYAVIIKYAAEALRHTMDGDLTPPKLSAEVINENYELPFKLLIVIFCYYFVTDRIVDQSSSFAMAMTIAIFFEILIPAIVASLIITDEIGYALNPVNWFTIPLRIGWGYLVMVIFLTLFNFIEYFFTGVIASHISRDLVGPLWMAIDTSFTVIMFHLMGYVVMQYHEQLGYEAPSIDEGDSKQGEPSASGSTLTTPLLERFMEEGNVAAALAELSSLIQENPQDLELRRRMYNYMRASGEHERLKQYAPHYFGMLADHGRFSDATTVYLDSQQREEAFQPTKAFHYLPVLQELRRRGAGKKAVLLAQGFHKRFPDDPNTPALYLEMSQILSEELQRDDLAQQALRFILQKFPGHEVIPDVKQYLDVIIKLQQQSSAPASP